MKNKDDLFELSGLDDNTAEKIGEKYPDMTADEAERIFSRTMAKINFAADDGEAFGDAVSGTEPVIKRSFRGYAASAAAVVLIAAAIPAMIYGMNRAPETPDDHTIENMTLPRFTLVDVTEDETTTSAENPVTDDREEPTDAPYPTAPVNDIAVTKPVGNNGGNVAQNGNSNPKTTARPTPKTTAAATTKAPVTTAAVPPLDPKRPVIQRDFTNVAPVGVNIPVYADAAELKTMAALDVSRLDRYRRNGTEIKYSDLSGFESETMFDKSEADKNIFWRFYKIPMINVLGGAQPENEIDGYYRNYLAVRFRATENEPEVIDIYFYQLDASVGDETASGQYIGYDFLKGEFPMMEASRRYMILIGTTPEDQERITPDDLEVCLRYAYEDHLDGSQYRTSLQSYLNWFSGGGDDMDNENALYYWFDDSGKNGIKMYQQKYVFVCFFGDDEPPTIDVTKENAEAIRDALAESGQLDPNSPRLTQLKVLSVKYALEDEGLSGEEYRDALIKELKAQCGAPDYSLNMDGGEYYLYIFEGDEKGLLLNIDSGETEFVSVTK